VDTSAYVGLGLGGEVAKGKSMNDIADLRTGFEFGDGPVKLGVEYEYVMTDLMWAGTANGDHRVLGTIAYEFGGQKQGGWGMFRQILFALADATWYLAKKFGSKGWGGVDGAYRHGRDLREVEYKVWKRARDKAVPSRTLGDLDDSAIALAKGNQRFEIEDYHVQENLQVAREAIERGEYDEAGAVLDSQIEILTLGRPKD
jgi:hypothetical protein